MVLSVPWHVAQVVVIGASPLALSVWQTATLVEILFHHSNVELPVAVERWLGRLIVTPRMHGIHHSIVPEETASNWSSGLTLWDWLHGTLRLNVPQEEIVVGVPAYRKPEEVTLPKVLAMPFVEQRDSWRLPGDGTPHRPPVRRSLETMQFFTALRIPEPYGVIVATRENSFAVRIERHAVYTLVMATETAYFLGYSHIPEPHRAIGATGENAPRRGRPPDTAPPGRPPPPKRTGRPVPAATEWAAGGIPLPEGEF